MVSVSYYSVRRFYSHLLGRMTCDLTVSQISCIKSRHQTFVVRHYKYLLCQNTSGTCWNTD